MYIYITIAHLIVRNISAVKIRLIIPASLTIFYKRPKAITSYFDLIDKVERW